ncbi:MAG: hypothetical protein EBT51_02675 [Flavobacteriaceae bacterium]|nr:hypothetical protein [Flavobacteriaceae bacterium]
MQSKMVEPKTPDREKLNELLEALSVLLERNSNLFEGDTLSDHLSVFVKNFTSQNRIIDASELNQLNDILVELSVATERKLEILDFIKDIEFLKK